MANPESKIQNPKSAIVFLKLGGSLITDKTKVEHARTRLIRRLARELKAARAARPDLQLVLGHGSGSFGHVAAQKHGTRDGIKDASGWFGYAKVAAAAAQLNQIVTDIFVEEGIPVVSLPPSASARCTDGRLTYLDTFALQMALQHGLVPLVQGDVAFDDVRGATIVSTEDVFIFLVREIAASYILLAGEVAGVYENADMTGRLIDVITPQNIARYTSALGGSRGADVTGGMSGKVHQMLRAVQQQPHLKVRIFSGAKPGNVEQLLVDPETTIGTQIHYE